MAKTCFSLADIAEYIKKQTKKQKQTSNAIKPGFLYMILLSLTLIETFMH